MSFSQLLIEKKKSQMNSEEKLEIWESEKNFNGETLTLSKEQDIINEIETAIFQQTGFRNNFTKNNVQMGEGQILSTYFLKGKSNQDITFYMGHGFGGTSLMYFPIFTHFLEKGNIVAWEVRGMGIGIKNQYPEIEDDKINQFYVQGLVKIMSFYGHKKIIFVSHSLGAYITLRYLMEYPQDNRIIKAILLSPIGITAKDRDYKDKISSPSLLVDALVNSFGWKFRLTFKSPLRTILRCLKRTILKRSFSQFPLKQAQLDTMVKLFQALIQLPDGSENIFFRYFLPRVLPRQGESIQQLIQKTKITKSIQIYYGGQQDWVDKTGAERLCKDFNNFKMQMFQDSGHMICLNPQLMKYVLDAEFK